MRILTFAAPADYRRYKMLYQTLVFSPTELGKAELMPHGRMLEAFQSIGEQDKRTLPTDEEPDMLALFNLGEDGGIIALEETQYALLRKMFKTTLPKFPKAWSLDVDTTYEWLRHVKEEVVAKKAAATATGEVPAASPAVAFVPDDDEE
jgi:hypothetical protein